MNDNPSDTLPAPPAPSGRVLRVIGLHLIGALSLLGGVALFLWLVGAATPGMLFAGARDFGLWLFAAAVGVLVLVWVLPVIMHALLVVADYAVLVILWIFNRSDFMLENQPIPWYSTRWLPWEIRLGDTVCGLIRATPGVVLGLWALGHPESPSLWLAVAGVLILISGCSWAVLMFGLMVLGTGAYLLDPACAASWLAAMTGAAEATIQFTLALLYTLAVILSTYGFFRIEDERLQNIRGLGDSKSAFYAQGPPDWADKHATYRLPKLPLLTQRPVLFILCAGIILSFARLAQAAWGVHIQGFDAGAPPYRDFAAWILYSGMNVFNALDIFDTVHVFRIDESVFGHEAQVKGTVESQFTDLRVVLESHLPQSLFHWLTHNGLNEVPMLDWRIRLLRSEGFAIQSVVWILRAAVDLMLLRKVASVVSNHLVYGKLCQTMKSLTITIGLLSNGRVKRVIDEYGKEEGSEERRKLQTARLGGTLEELGSSYIISFIKQFLLRDEWHPKLGPDEGYPYRIPDALAQFAGEVVAASGAEVVQCRKLFETILRDPERFNKGHYQASDFRNRSLTGILSIQYRTLELIGQLKENGVSIGRPLRWRTAKSTNTSSETPPHSAHELFGCDFDWVVIPQGVAVLGSTNPKDDNPGRTVENGNSFALLRCPVTIAQWRRITGFGPAAAVDHTVPVTLVTWYSACGWCEWVNWRMARQLKGWWLRLPTEREWEYACLGGHEPGPEGRYQVVTEVNGELTEPPLDEVAWHGGNSGKWYVRDVPPCYTKIANAFGLHDMLGCVAEWCWDWHARIDSGEEETLSHGMPRGPRQGERRVVRGGHYWSDGHECRTAAREGINPKHCSCDIYGFRPALVPHESCVAPPPPPPPPPLPAD